MHLKLSLLLIAVYFVLPAYAGKKLKVLFLGNSYTYVNNMPQIVADMAASTGDTLVYEMYAVGGYTLDNHGQDTAARNRIKKGNWDYMVLQEQSQLPALQYYYSNEVSGLCNQFRQYSPCGRIIFYMTWGRKNGDALNCATWPPVCTYLGMDSMLRLRYIQMATDNYAELAPVGAAWRYVRATGPSINLYDTDDSHPVAAGSYLSAASFYAILFIKDPVNISYNFGLNSFTAGTLKNAAKKVVFDSLSFWDYKATMPVTGFRYMIDTGVNRVVFINTSMHADSYLWEFGDGATSADAQPLHQYTADGTYTVTLHAYNCDIDTTYEQIRKLTLSFCPFTPVITPKRLSLCPGAADTLRTQAFDSYQWYDINETPIPGATGQYYVTSTGNWYYMEATKNGCTERSAPAIVDNAGFMGNMYIRQAGRLINQDTACFGDTIILTATSYKPPAIADSLIDWYIDGIPVTGLHNDTLLITRSGLYEAVMHHPICPSLNRTLDVSFTFIQCPVTITNINAESISIAPNPVTDLLTITSVAFAEGNYTVHIADCMGRTVVSKICGTEVSQSINMSAFSNGLYFVSITKEGRVLYRDKIIRQ